MDAPQGWREHGGLAVVHEELVDSLCLLDDPLDQDFVGNIEILQDETVGHAAAAQIAVFSQVETRGRLVYAQFSWLGRLAGQIAAH